MLILWYFEYTTVVKISENEIAFKIAAWGLKGLCDNGIFYNNFQRDLVRVCARKNKIQLDSFNLMNFGGALMQLGA